MMLLPVCGVTTDSYYHVQDDLQYSEKNRPSILGDRSDLVECVFESIKN